jgi:hypothetical protein
MTLLEVLLSGVLFLGASAASLAVWSGAVASMDADARRMEALDGLEAELQAAEIRLLDPGLLASPAVACGLVVERLAMALDREPPVAGVVRQIQWPNADEPLRLRLVAGDQRRERAYSPAAFGGCSPSPPSGDAGDSAASPAAIQPIGGPSAAAALPRTEGHGAI